MPRPAHLIRPALLAATLGLSACYLPLNVSAPPAVTPAGGQPAAAAATLASTRTTVELALNEERLLGDLLKDQNGLQPAPGAVLWQSTNPAVASVHPTTGQAKGVAPGTTVFVATLAGSPNARTQFEVKVVDKFTVRQITIEPANPTLVIGEKVSLRASVAMADGTISGNVVWSSSDDTIATVNPTNGEVTALKEGRVTIEGTYALDTKFKGVANVTVLREKGAPAPAPSTVVFGPGGTAPGGTEPGSPGTAPGTPVAAAGVPGRVVMQPSGSNQQLIAVDFADTLTGWAVVSGQGLLQTTDGGATWQTNTAGQLTTVGPVGVHFLGQNGVVLGSEAVHLTTDGGTTYARTDLPGQGLLKMQFQDAQVGFVFSNINGPATATYFRTTDGGTTWSKVSVPGTGGVFDAVRVGAADVVLGTTGVYVYDASLGGYDMRQAAWGQLRTHDWTRGSVLGTDGRTVWLFNGQDQHLLASDDQGLTWRDGGTLKGVDGLTIATGLPRELLAFPTGELYLLASGGFFTSADRGATWARAEGLGGDYYDASFPTARTGWLVGANGQIARFNGR